jgi:hypothetical protein
MPGKIVTVSAARLARWVDGFAERHGGPSVVGRDGAALVLTAPDGARAAFTSAFPLPAHVEDVTGLLSWVGTPRRCAVVLVRRGGYACALLDTGRAGAAAVTASKVGTRYVQSRTAAGGWSQQRFARRRDNQARDLTRAVADHAVRLVPPGSADWLVTGGDRALVEAVLGDPRLRALTAMHRGPHLTVGDPRASDVRGLTDRLAEVRIDLTEPSVPA